MGITFKFTAQIKHLNEKYFTRSCFAFDFNDNF